MMKIYSMEVRTDLGCKTVQPPAPIDIEPSGVMPPLFRSLTEDLWKKDRQSMTLKIYSMEVRTDLGRRVVQLSAPMDVDPTGDMPKQFRSLTEMLWGVVCEVAKQGPALSPPKVEA